MADLTEKQRDKMKGSTFGLPGERKYPMPDRKHAANAKARASQQYNKGNLSEAEKAKIDRKADKILGEDKPAKKKEYPMPPSRFQKKD
jgi:hypothetical protein